MKCTLVTGQILANGYESYIIGNTGWWTYIPDAKDVPPRVPPYRRAQQAFNHQKARIRPCTPRVLCRRRAVPPQTFQGSQHLHKTEAAIYPPSGTEGDAMGPGFLQCNDEVMEEPKTTTTCNNPQTKAQASQLLSFPSQDCVSLILVFLGETKELENGWFENIFHEAQPESVHFSNYAFHCLLCARLYALHCACRLHASLTSCLCHFLLQCCRRCACLGGIEHDLELGL